MTKGTQGTNDSGSDEQKGECADTNDSDGDDKEEEVPRERKRGGGSSAKCG